MIRDATCFPDPAPSILPHRPQASPGTAHHPHCSSSSQKVSLGQLFREIGVLPTFTLHSAGIGDTFFWRTYQLSAAGMTCEINETFSTDVFDRYGA